MNFDNGEKILLEMKNGYRWEATVLEHVTDEQGEDYLRAILEGHPAIGKKLSATVDLESERVKASNKGYEDYVAIWKRFD